LSGERVRAQVQPLQIAMGGFPDLVVSLLSGVAHTFDLLLYPIYVLWFRPAETLAKRNGNRVDMTFLHGEDAVLLERKDKVTVKVEADHVYQHVKSKMTLRPDAPCLGTRQITGEITEQNADGKIWSKPVMKPYYSWKTSREVLTQIDDVAAGLKTLEGLKPKDKVIIYADTCSEWMVTALACFKNNYTIVTLYTNLGTEGVVYGIQQVEAKVIVTGQQLLPKLIETLATFDNKVQHVVFFEHPFKKTLSMEPPPCPADKMSINVVSLATIEDMGKDMDDAMKEPEKVSRDDVGMIMYTSGSTGKPKGVILSHENLVGCLTINKEFLLRYMGKNGERECYLAYLPAAHIFEIMIELIMVAEGVQVGFSTPLTLTDTSPKIVNGTQGDATILKPRYLIAVPTVLDRVYKAVMAKFSKASPLMNAIFNFSLEYKRRWVALGFDTPLLNAIIFKKLRDSLGGKVHLLLSGGAPLNPDIEEFFRLTISPRLATTLGMTEFTGAVSLGDEYGGLGEVGIPNFNTTVRLEDWEDGGYRVTDKDGPRGEILVSGTCLASGYYKCQDEAANASFFEDGEGKTWFRTGDIAHANPTTGSLSIIDRKKDLVKLQMGEYVSLGKVESTIKVLPIVESICVYASPLQTAAVALIVPDEAKLRALAAQLGKQQPTLNREEICQDEDVRKHVLGQIVSAAKGRLQNFEVPKNLRLISDQWTPEGGLLTSAMKLKRKQIQNKYQLHIDQMYKDIESKRAGVSHQA